MRIDITLKRLDPSKEEGGYDKIMLCLFKYSSALTNCKGAQNVLYYGKTEEMPDSLLEVIIGEGGNNVVGYNSETVLFKKTSTPKESIQSITNLYPQHIYCSISKVQSKYL